MGFVCSLPLKAKGHVGSGRKNTCDSRGPHCGWTNSCTTLETMANHCLLVFTLESSFQGFLGGAKWILSIHGIIKGDVTFPSNKAQIPNFVSARAFGSCWAARKRSEAPTRAPRSAVDRAAEVNQANCSSTSLDLYVSHNQNPGK